MRELILCLLLVLAPVFAQAERSELSKIESLISQVESMDAVFIRNGKEHSPRDAAAHLRRKLTSALRSIRSADVNARDFVIQVASKSHFTGQPYSIRFKDGRIVSARSWLLSRLATLD